ncbi:MAG: hemerythrin domain-containing protein [Bacteroidales bacterium]|nr:hemerythrin domain-containing protein [Bacteroidales bacterium]
MTSNIITVGTITPQMELHDLIEKNIRILLLMEHFGTGFTVADLTIEELCRLRGINPEIFACFCNLYNGSDKICYEPKTIEDINQIIEFLENAHRYYLDEMYPEIKYYIKKLSEINETDDIKMVEKFFESYFSEVKKHLDYEQKKLFPLLRSEDNAQKGKTKIHHGDIETKLADLKNLLLKHIRLIDKNGLKRKLLTALFEFQFDLNIHSLIEDKILIPIALKK